MGRTKWFFLQWKFIKFRKIQLKLKRKRTIIKQTKKNKIKRKYHKTYLHTQESKDNSDFSTNQIKVIEKFIREYEQFDSGFDSLNNLIEEFIKKSQSFLSDKDLVKKNPDDDCVFNNILNQYRDVLTYLLDGSRKKEKHFRLFLKYYTKLRQYRKKWKKIKKRYFACIDMQKLLKELEKRYIAPNHKETLEAHKSYFKFSQKARWLKESYWDFSIFKDNQNFFYNLSVNIEQRNYKFLDTHIYHEFKSKDLTIELKENYLSHKLNCLTYTHLIPDEDIDNYFTSKHSKIDDPFENIIAHNLKCDFGSEIKIIPNIYLETGSSDLPYTQIDLIVFYKGNIYVLELKNYSGKIYGGYKSKKWKQVLSPSRESYARSTSVEIHNPIKQNLWHIKCIKRKFSYHYENVVLFSDKSILKAPENIVMHYDDFCKKIKGAYAYPEGKMNEAYYRLSLLNQGRSTTVQNSHVKSMRDYINKQKQ